jgi:hypothetical protein
MGAAAYQSTDDWNRRIEMHVNGSELISRPTQVAARSLLVFSSSTILIIRNGLDPNRWELLNGDLQADTFFDALLLVIGFLLVSLLVNWWGDYVSYRSWFKSNEVSRGSAWDDFSHKAGEPPVRWLKCRMDELAVQNRKLERASQDLNESIEKIDANKDDKEYFIKSMDQLVRVTNTFHNTWEGTRRQVGAVSALLDELDARFERVDFAARFYVFIWHLALPVVLALTSICMLLSL